MNLLARMTLKQKLCLAVLVPVLGLLWFGQSEIRRAANNKTQAERVLVLTELAVTASAMVHELQKERGMSAGYLGSNGQKFADALPQQHTTADTRIETLEALLRGFDRTDFNDAFQQQLQESEQMLGQIGEWRKRILSQSTTVGEGISYYTSTNGAFLKLVEAIPQQIASGRIAIEGVAFSAFLQSKERAGIERAVLASVFAKDRFEPGMLERLLALVTIQDTYLDRFRSFAPQASIDALRAAETDVAMTRPERFRRQAIDNADVGGFGVDPAVWFEAQTAKIDQLKSLEDSVANLLTLHATEYRQLAISKMLTATIIVAASVAAAIFMALYVVADTLRLLGAEPRRLRQVVDEVANGNLDLDISTERPASGVFASAQLMQQSLRKRAAEDRRTLAEMTRIREALDNIDGNVIIVNQEHRVVYANPAITKLLDSIAPSLRQIVPHFTPGDLTNLTFDDLHDNCSLTQDTLARLNRSQSEMMELAGLTLRVNINPILSASGSRLGTVVEWRDRTKAVAAEKEVQAVVRSAGEGDLGVRISVDDKDEFLRALAEGVNRLLETSEGVISETTRVLGAVAAGDLSNTIDSDYAGAYEQLKQDTNATVAKLREVVAEIQQAADSVGVGSSEISEGNANLSERTEQQAGSLEETASSMEQMTSSVRQNADNASQANQLALDAREQAKQGGNVVSTAVSAMAEISTASGKIADIIGVVDEIAFQTNLLALNASVEAARAGEQGRGFAVVASEVRNLAGRSATAAREIKTLIDDSVDKVKDGTALVNESGEMLSEIVDRVTKVTDIVGEIAAASQEQSAGIEQVNSAVVKMDELTQQNAALVEQAAAASESLSDQAADLNGLISFFGSANNTIHIATQPPPTDFVERRSTERPWTERKPADAGQNGPAEEDTPLLFGTAAAAFGGAAPAKDGDAEWQEF
ncbi:MAG: nitrate- and nitrite sensing domain-containing protein [Pseudomonadota bacterium]